MNRIDKLFREKKRNILSIYFTAGYPFLNSTPDIIRALSEAGADMVEIGIPFSDPVADGPVIQHSSRTALRMGMNISLLFRQLRHIRDMTRIPLIIMSYINPVMKFGVDRFTDSCNEAGVDGVIIPDLPPEVYKKTYRDLFLQKSLKNILMISPGNSSLRIRKIDRLCSGFIYVVSSSSTTGMKNGFSQDQESYFSRIKEMNLKNPGLIGFGISGKDTFIKACEYASGAIIGSAFVKYLGSNGTCNDSIKEFISAFRS